MAPQTLLLTPCCSFGGTFFIGLAAHLIAGCSRSGLHGHNPLLVPVTEYTIVSICKGKVTSTT